MTKPFPRHAPIRDDCPKLSELTAALRVCPACGGFFNGKCGFCGLTRAAVNAPPKRIRLTLAGAPLAATATVLLESVAALDLDPAGYQVMGDNPGAVDAVIAVAVLEAARDPLEAFVRWRSLLKNNGVLLVVLARPETAPVWDIGRPALMRLAERAGFRMIRHPRFSRRWWFRRY